MATSTPWGRSDDSKQERRGIVFYTTPSHGGYHLRRTRNAFVHPALRRENGWYEEDCEYAIVHMTFPAIYTQKQVEDARATVRNYWPDEYTEATKEVVTLEQSSVLRERAARVKHANDWIAVAAWGDWHSRVPPGMVGVLATLGASREDGREERYFMVTKEEYQSPDHRCLLGFIVDPLRHESIEPIKTMTCAGDWKTGSKGRPRGRSLQIRLGGGKLREFSRP